MTQFPNYKSFKSFGDWDFGHYLIIGAWNLVIFILGHSSIEILHEVYHLFPVYFPPGDLGFSHLF